ncbi:MAG: hypothetical protein A2Y40_09125 [Candidatus Margulisbacteria bacterium GWF2_35_9]|nr:MAG: hypothetical protein A2Y40_09125 [Candidatus Margulisbacteria bacterium GWF2_35_9]
MKVGVYLCECGTNITEKVDLDQVSATISELDNVGYVSKIGLMCSYDGVSVFEDDLQKQKPDRVVVAACSPRDHEATFMKAMTKVGINQYLMQMVNFREQLSWVTEDKQAATDKAIVMLKGAIARVVQQEALEKKSITMNNDVLIIGAGPAGLKAALTLAEADRKVTIIEKSPMIGGLPVRYEELFPKMECGPCMLEPIEHEILHGDHAENIEIITQAELKEVKGFYGNFIAKIIKAPRYVDTEICIGCAECVGACPVSVKNPMNSNMNEKKAMDFTFFGALPNATYIDYEACLRSKGESCEACKTACPIEGAVIFDDKEEIIEKNVGAILLAIGTQLYDATLLPNLGYGALKDVVTSYEFERILSSGGPTGGQILKSNGDIPKSIAIIHCVGSLDENHKSYCSGTCCQTGFKFAHELHHKVGESTITHFYKQLVFPGKSDYPLYKNAMNNSHAKFVNYLSTSDINVVENKKGVKTISYKDVSGISGEIEADMIILLPATIPGLDNESLSSLLEVNLDKEGFFEELHGLVDSVRSKVKGIFVAGSCQSPTDIKGAVNQGVAAAGYMLSGLVPGRKLEIEPIVAEVIEDKCAGCHVCVLVCPYKAIQFNEETKKSSINAVLCQGCGTCVSACPANAIIGHHFTKEEIYEEIRGVLS